MVAAHAAAPYPPAKRFRGQRCCSARRHANLVKRYITAAELAAAAQAVAPFMAAEQRRRSGGLDVRVRTIAYCGASGTVSYSMLGAFLPGFA